MSRLGVYKNLQRKLVFTKVDMTSYGKFTLKYPNIPFLTKVIVYDIATSIVYLQIGSKNHYQHSIRLIIVNDYNYQEFDSYLQFNYKKLSIVVRPMIYFISYDWIHSVINRQQKTRYECLYEGYKLIKNMVVELREM
jgi:hypothetical protein